MSSSPTRVVDLTSADDIDVDQAIADVLPFDSEGRVNVSAELRRARRRRRISVKKAVEQTRIPQRYLEALERGARVDAFPAPVYAKFFLAEYARLLGLDPEPLMKSFDVTPGPLSQLLEPIPGRWERTHRWTGRIAAVVCAAVLVGIVLVQVVGGRPTSRAPVETLPEAPRAAASGATAPSTNAPPKRVVRGVKVILRLSAPSWISATTDGKQVLRQTLPAGRRVTLRAKRTLDLILGNAGGVSMAVNGKRMATGQPGQVIHIRLVWRDRHVVTVL
jgi:cytoskeleton protein RodZ